MSTRAGAARRALGNVDPNKATSRKEELLRWKKNKKLGKQSLATKQKASKRALGTRKRKALGAAEKRPAKRRGPASSKFRPTRPSSTHAPGKSSITIFPDPPSQADAATSGPSSDQVTRLKKQCEYLKKSHAHQEAQKRDLKAKSARLETGELLCEPPRRAAPLVLTPGPAPRHCAVIEEQSAEIDALHEEKNAQKHVDIIQRVRDTRDVDVDWDEIEKSCGDSEEAKFNFQAILDDLSQNVVNDSSSKVLSDRLLNPELGEDASALIIPAAKSTISKNTAVANATGLFKRVIERLAQDDVNGALDIATTAVASLIPHRSA